MHTASSDNTEPSFFSRVLNADATRKGAAGAVAGLLVAVVTESLWPTK